MHPDELDHSSSWCLADRRLRDLVQLELGRDGRCCLEALGLGHRLGRLAQIGLRARSGVVLDVVALDPEG